MSQQYAASTNPVFERLFPRADQWQYRGHQLAVWLLSVVLLVKLAIALGSTFNAEYAAGTADGVPLQRFGSEGAAAFLSVFRLLGLAQAVFALCGVVIVVRYRALMPAYLLVLIAEYAARRAVLWLYATPAAEPVSGGSGVSAGLVINLVLLTLMLTAFWLSLRRPRTG